MLVDFKNRMSKGSKTRIASNDDNSVELIENCLQMID